MGPRTWTEKEYEREKQRQEKRLEKAKREKAIYDRRMEVLQIKKEMRLLHPPTTTKLLMAFILANCSVVEIYSMIAMWHLEDLSALYALITAVISESISFAVYAAKSYNETKQAEIISLERYKVDNGLTEEDTVPDREAAMG